jgi:hypothetical protein
MQEVVEKTGHDMRGARESTVSKYMDGDDLLLCYGSAALAGWSNPCNQVFPPTLRTVITDDTLILKFSNLSSLMYEHGFPLTKMQNMQGLIHTMLATFLMYLSEFKEDCHNIHDKVKRQPNYILSAFKEKIQGIFAIAECLSFRLKIKEEWSDRNNTGVNTDMEGVQLSVERLQTECMKIRSENRELKAQLIAIKDDSRRFNNILDSIETNMTSVLEQMSKMNSSPSNRRKSPEEEIALNSNQKRGRSTYT